MDNLNFTHDKLCIDQLQELASLPRCAAISVFVGTARDDLNRQEVLDSSMSYEVYVSVALTNLTEICKEIREKWPEVGNVVVRHRLGSIPAKETSMVVAISSPNRKDSIDATEFCVDCIKSRVPVWKKATLKDEKPEWKENHESYLPKRRIFCMKRKLRAYMPYTQQSHQIQVKVESNEYENRIEKLMNCRRAEIDRNNIQKFIEPTRDPEFSCARTDSPLKSKLHFGSSHLSDDIKNSRRNQPLNEVEERLQSSKTLISNTAPVSKCFYERLKNFEDRLMLLESESSGSGYIGFWNKTGVFSNTNKKKKVYSVKQVDMLIYNLEKRREKL